MKGRYTQTKEQNILEVKKNHKHESSVLKVPSDANSDPF